MPCMSERAALLGAAAPAMVDGFALRDGLTLLGVDGHTWTLENTYHDPNLGNGVHESTAVRDDGAARWPIRLSNVQARAARYEVAS